MAVNHAAPPPRSRHLLWRGALVAALAAILAGGAWYVARRLDVPQLPAVRLDGVEPAVAAAIEQALAQVRASPRDVATWTHLAKLLRGNDFLEPAAAAFDQLERLDPDNPPWPYLAAEALLLRGGREEALPRLQRAVELGERQGADSFAARLRLGETLLAAGRPDEATPHLRRAEALEPVKPNVHLAWAQWSFAQGDFEASRQRLQRCLESPTTRQRACALLATVERRLGDSERADQLSRRAADLPPDTAWHDPWVFECLRLGVGQDPRFRLVEQLENEGRTKEVVAALEEMLKLRADYRVLIGLGMNLIVLGDYAAAERYLRQALEGGGEPVQAWYLLSKLQWARGEEALRRGDKAAALGFFRQAAEAAEKALVHKPDHALALLVLGLSQKALGQRDQARESLRQAVTCAPELPDPSLELGELLAAMGQTAEARPHLEHAARIARPDDPRPRAALKRLGKAGP
jgi:tetratricopeptide (TPR) repeat protein